MNDRRPLVVVLAGPNGAGKSTSAARLLRGSLAVDEFVNADTIAQGLSAFRPETAAFAAGRIMIDRIRFLARARRDFAFETTLAGRAHGHMLARLRATGYRAHLLFLALPNPKVAIARVADRVRLGGHGVPDEIVERRFRAGLDNLFAYYLAMVDAWTIYENASLEGPRLIAFASGPSGVVVKDRRAWNRLRGRSR